MSKEMEAQLANLAEQVAILSEQVKGKPLTKREKLSVLPYPERAVQEAGFEGSNWEMKEVPADKNQLEDYEKAMQNAGASPFAIYVDPDTGRKCHVFALPPEEEDEGVTDEDKKDGKQPGPQKGPEAKPPKK